MDAQEDLDKDGLTNLVEYQQNTKLNDSDTDDDGLTDGEEVNAYGTDPLVADSDRDELPDSFEVRYGLNPAMATDAQEDPDRDSLSNLAEYQQGTNPNNADTDGDGLLDGEEIATSTDPNNSEDPPKTNTSNTTGEQPAYYIPGYTLVELVFTLGCIVLIVRWRRGRNNQKSSVE